MSAGGITGSRREAAAPRPAEIERLEHLLREAKRARWLSAKSKA